MRNDVSFDKKNFDYEKQFKKIYSFIYSFNTKLSPKKFDLFLLDFLNEKKILENISFWFHFDFF
jgi:hypothetical protein